MSDNSCQPESTSDLALPGGLQNATKWTGKRQTGLAGEVAGYFIQLRDSL